MVRIANNNMTNALKLVSINRGYDPRDFTMVAFGGGGAMHATALAAELSIPKVIVPAHSAVFSAWGMLMSDLRRDYIRTQPAVMNAAAAPMISGTFKEMEQEAREAYVAEGIAESRVRIEHSLAMRYEGQEHTVRIPVSNPNLDAETLENVLVDFRDAYEKEYSYRLDNAVEVVNFTVVAYASVDRPQLAVIEESKNIDAALKGSRRVDFDEAGIVDTAIYDRAKLGRGACFDGPAIVEEAGSTTVIFPGQKASVDDFGNLHIEI